MGEIVILSAVVLCALIIIIINSIESVRELIGSLKKNKIIRLLFYILIIAIAIVIIIGIIDNIIKTKNGITNLKGAKINQIMFEESDRKIYEESNYYNEMISKEYQSDSLNPYIPDGFTYKEGSVQEGYVITDKDGNEFVWVPCTNKESSDIPKLERRNFTELCSDIDLSYNTTYNEKYEDFIKSALENGGFYISRYELGTEENGNLVSKANKEIPVELTKKDFEEKMKKMYDNINCELINSYAYDTTLSWILKNPEFKIYKYDKNEEDIKTGRESINNIYDFTDNIMEVTQEVCYGNRIVRGFGYIEDIEKWSRYSLVSSQETYFDEYSLISTRAIIY